MPVNLFQHEHVVGHRFKLHSGDIVKWKIECDALVDWDLRALAKLASEKLHWKRVVSVPTGGDRFAHFLREFNRASGQTLIVDDVTTTGASLALKRKQVMHEHPELGEDDITGLVIFARGRPDDWVRAIFQMW